MVDAVSGNNVDAYVQRLQDFGTRYSTRDSCTAAANYIKREFESFGLDNVFFHHFLAGYNDNVIGVLRGDRNPQTQIVIGGHYDSNTAYHDDCPGADDNASGTSCVLESARVLSNYRFDHTIVFIAFCGEEQGLRGSERYAAEAAARGDDILAMVNVDMIGYVAPTDILDLDIIDDTNSEWLSDRALTVAGLYVPELSVVVGGRLIRGTSDHASFRAHGYDAILFHEDIDLSSPYIHTLEDVVGVSYKRATTGRTFGQSGRSARRRPGQTDQCAQAPNPSRSSHSNRIVQTHSTRVRRLATGSKKHHTSVCACTTLAGEWFGILLTAFSSPQDGYEVLWDGRNEAGQPVTERGLFLSHRCKQLRTDAQARVAQINTGTKTWS